MHTQKRLFMTINPQNIRIELYDYQLPDERIAKYPLEQRDKSKLLIYNKGNISSNTFSEIDYYIPENSTLVFNNTKVIQARLKFYKETGAQIEIFCLEPIEPSDYALAFEQTEKVTWKCIVGNLKKWKTEDLKSRIRIKDSEIEIVATKKGAVGNTQIIEFKWNNNLVSFSEILENVGVTPIPPYLNRESENIDKERYQTVYSKFKGSVAAPTAGLHFTKPVLEKLQTKDIKLAEITLHVGAGTFTPVKSETVNEHEMHTEHFVVKKETIQQLLDAERIVAVGTTSVRTIESLYWIGVKLIFQNKLDTHITQWEPYNLKTDIFKEEALQALFNYMNQNDLKQIEASTQIMIVPGYDFKMIDLLITNFHQPKSTLLLLIAAFIGDDWKNVYRYALENGFRFLSYGDSSVLIP